MARIFIILLSLFTVTIRVNAQFYDLFQGFQPFLQNFQTTKPEYNIFGDFSQTRLQNDQNYRNGDRQTDRRKTKTTTTIADFYLGTYTTSKPVRKSIKNNSSHRTESSSKNKNVVTSNQRTEDIKRQEDNSHQRRQENSSNERRRYDDAFTTSNIRRQTGLKVGDSKKQEDNSNTRRQENPSNERKRYDDPFSAFNHRRPTNVESSTQRRQTNAGSSTERRQSTNRRRYDENFNNIVYTEEPTITSRPNHATTKRYSQNYNSYTHRPGVRPAPVDTNRPPITNRPPTTRPFATYPRPTDSSAIRFPEDPDTSPEMLVGPDEDKMSSAEKRRYISLAEKMCDTYKSFNVKKVEAIPLLPSPEPVQLNVTVCPASTVPLVVGGKVVNIEEFPHMALLGWTKIQGSGYSWKCGGSLISDQYVLTAGHCAFQEKDDTVVTGGPRVVQLGSSYMDDTGALVMKVLNVVRHPKYVRPRSYYDIALVKLVRPVTFSKVVKPACLGEPPGVGESIIATGWGRTEFSGSQSLELRSVSIPIWDTDECREVLGVSRKMPQGPSPDSQICAGEKQGGKDTCQGDSGGPAQIQDGCVWRVVAVTSVGRSCGAPNTPAIYATLHRAFIAAQIFGNAEATKNNQQGNKNTNSQTPRPSNNDRPNRNNNGNGINNPANGHSQNSNNNGLINNQNSWNTNAQNSNNNRGFNNQNNWSTNAQNNNNNGGLNNNPNNWSTNSQNTNSGNKNSNSQSSWNNNSQNNGNRNNNNRNSWNNNEQNSNGFENSNNNRGEYQSTNNNNNGNYKFSNYDNNNANRRGGYDYYNSNYNNNDYDDYYESNREGRHKNFKSNFVTTSKPNWLIEFGVE